MDASTEAIVDIMDAGLKLTVAKAAHRPEVILMVDDETPSRSPLPSTFSISIHVDNQLVAKDGVLASALRSLVRYYRDNLSETKGMSTTLLFNALHDVVSNDHG